MVRSNASGSQGETESRKSGRNRKADGQATAQIEIPGRVSRAAHGEQVPGIDRFFFFFFNNIQQVLILDIKVKPFPVQQKCVIFLLRFSFPFNPCQYTTQYLVSYQRAPRNHSKSFCKKTRYCHEFKQKVLRFDTNLGTPAADGTFKTNY